VGVTTASPLRAAAGSVIAGRGCSLKGPDGPGADDNPFRPGTPARYRDDLRAHPSHRRRIALHLIQVENAIAAGDAQITIARIPDLRSGVRIGVAYAEWRTRELPSQL
jgi:hypothetical protein